MEITIEDRKASYIVAELKRLKSGRGGKLMRDYIIHPKDMYEWSPHTYGMHIPYVDG